MTAMDETDGTARKQRKARSDELGAAVELMRYPVVMSAIGMTLATQAMATWLTAVASAAEASHRLLQSPGDVDRAPAPAVSPRAEETVRSVIDGAAEAARDVARQGETVAVAVEKANRVIRGMSGKPAIEKAARKSRAKEPAAPVKASQPAAIARPGRPDDLKAIAGVGPKLEQVLNGFGIWTYAQMAAWSPEEIAWIEDVIGAPGRIGRDGWVAQAAVLSGLKA